MATAEPGSQRQELAAYRRKRNFARTPEPAGAAPLSGADPLLSTGDRPLSADDPLLSAGDGPPPADVGAARFVVQRHRATRLHYDFRLEVDGVLVSWAVPKGPTLDPGVRRAAFAVEDHPLEYIDFEGVIPRAEYGGGDVIVWDAGTWRSTGSGGPRAAIDAGELHLDLFGRKLRGRFLLTRTRTAGGKQQWLLVHKHDDVAVAGWNPEDHPRSVLSGRTNDEVQADPDRLWRSDLPAARAALQLKTAAGPTDDELAQLDALHNAGIWSVFGRQLRVTNLDKELFAARPHEQPVTKRELLRYAACIAPVAVPYLTQRALNLHRFPGGADTAGFWHKELPDHAPDWLGRWNNPEARDGETQTYLVVDEPAALVWATNFGGLEWHAWTSRIDQPHQPTYALVDLDPGGTTSWNDILVLARLHRTALEHLGVRAVPKVTGRRGIQIWIPIKRGPSFDDTRAWVEQLSKSIGAVVPELVSWKWHVADRGGLARLDYTQNAINRTLVAPYSPRPAPGAPVSAPIEWAELDDPSLRPDGFTVRTIVDRVAAKGDLFRDVLDPTQTLPPLG